MRTIALAAFIVGIVILAFGINSTLTVTEQVVEGVSGRYTSNTMYYLLGGLALVVGGGATAFLYKE